MFFDRRGLFFSSRTPCILVGSRDRGGPHRIFYFVSSRPPLWNVVLPEFSSALRPCST